MKFLELDEVIVIHEKMIDVGGGKKGIHEFTLLHSAVERPKAKFGGTFLYDSLFLMSAALLQSLVKNHPFVDGNKRTSYYSTKRFLLKNSVILTIDSQEVVDFMVQVDTHNKSIEEIASWLEKFSKPTKN